MKTKYNTENFKNLNFQVTDGLISHDQQIEHYKDLLFSNSLIPTKSAINYLFNTIDNEKTSTSSLEYIIQFITSSKLEININDNNNNNNNTSNTNNFTSNNSSSYYFLKNFYTLNLLILQTIKPRQNISHNEFLLNINNIFKSFCIF